MNKKIQKTLIIGLGLIGGSFAKALKKHNLSEEIFAFGAGEETIEFALKNKIIDGEIKSDKEIADFDLIIIASPLLTYKEVLKKISKNASQNALIIDFGSLKEFIKEILPKNIEENFVFCHPIAGSDKKGIASSNEDLYLNKTFIICKETTPRRNINKATAIIEAIGAKIELLDSKKHDEIYALVSHLPQFLSFLTSEISPKNIKDDFFKAAFRLNNSNPEIWTDIFELNQNNMERFYIKFYDNLEQSMLDPDESIEEHKKGKKPQFDEKFFIKNFATIFFRALIVKNYLKIAEIKKYSSYSGSGFKDFTSIIDIFNYDKEQLLKLTKKNHLKIIELFESIS